MKKRSGISASLPGRIYRPSVKLAPVLKIAAVWHKKQQSLALSHFI
ncbi:MAG: hypothetical protein QNJ32_29465 [Xenococcaceae cyanobacterium MO_167.B27]|nr:hypothetical protein [Xenococcaceae cyanobacterium MO_167.B27]